MVFHDDKVIIAAPFRTGMKTLSLVTLIFSTFFTMNTNAQSATEQEIIQLSADKYRWYTEKNIQKVEELYDDSLVFIHLTGHVSSKKEWIVQIRSGSFVYNQISVK